MVVIRPLEAGHAGIVSAFFREIDTPVYRENFAPHPFTEAMARRVCGHEGKDLYVGVFWGERLDRMIGYGMLRGLDEGYSIPALGLCLLDSHQNHGIGRKLLGYLLEACVERGAARAMLKVKRENLRACKLYESAGFEFTDLDSDFLVGHCSLSADTHPETK